MDLGASCEKAASTEETTSEVSWEGQNENLADARKYTGTPFEKLEILWGQEAVGRLAKAKVVVLGLGGVGSNCVEALARGGVGSFVLLDHDVVSPSNINRQAIAFHSTLGQKKCHVMEAMVKDINPSSSVLALDRFLWAQEAAEFLEEYACDADYVVDAIDSISTKLALAEYADKNGIPLISSMGGGNKLHPECFKIADIYDTVNDSLSRIMRKEGRKRGIRSLKVLYSSEPNIKIQPQEGADRKARSHLGTASYIPPIMGQMIAGEVLRTIAFGDDALQEVHTR